MTRSTASRASSLPARSPDLGGWWTLLGGILLAASCAGRLLTATEAAPAGGTLGLAVLSALALAVLTAGRAWNGTPPPRWQLVDALIALFCGAPLLSFLVASPTADLRAGTSLIAEWCGLWATWCSLRTLQTETAWVARLQRLIACLVFALALLGIWQNLVGYQQARADYRNLKAELVAAQQRLTDSSDPATRLRARDDVRRLEAIYLELGIPLDPAGQVLWESRLEHSQEPVGLFALANTFAAALLTGLAWWLWPAPKPFRAPPGAKPAASTRETPAVREPRSTRVGWGRVLAVVPIAFCLLLTKCRSAWLAGLAMAPLAVWMTWREAQGARETPGTSPLPRRLWLAGAVLGLGLVAAAVAGGQLDRLVVLESFKSLRYRVEYWRGTWQMLTAPEHPTRWLTGVGPGQFRANYLPFKLPVSSEEIADPHNALFDHWASGGLPGLLAVVGLWGWSLWLMGSRSSRVAAPAASVVSETVPPARPEVAALLLTVGGLALLTPDTSLQLQLTTVGGLALVALPLARAWSPGVVPAGRAGVLLLGLLIHLLFAGGVALPAVAQLLLLWALPEQQRAPTERVAPNTLPGPASTTSARLPASEGVADSLGGPGWSPRSLAAVVRPVLALGTAVAIIQWALLPVIRRDVHLARGDEALERGQLPAAEREFRRAAEADRWSLLPRERLALAAEFRWQASATPAAGDPSFEEAVRRRRAVIELQPEQANSWRSLGELWERAQARDRETEAGRDAARQAADAFAEAARRHPTQAAIQASLASMQAASGDRETAIRTARRALELEASNQRLGHLDKQLPAETLRRLEQLVEPPPTP